MITKHHLSVKQKHCHHRSSRLYYWSSFPSPLMDDLESPSCFYSSNSLSFFCSNDSIPDFLGPTHTKRRPMPYMQCSKAQVQKQQVPVHSVWTLHSFPTDPLFVEQEELLCPNDTPVDATNNIILPKKKFPNNIYVLLMQHLMISLWQKILFMSLFVVPSIPKLICVTCYPHILHNLNLYD